MENQKASKHAYKAFYPVLRYNREYGCAKHRNESYTLIQMYNPTYKYILP